MIQDKSFLHLVVMASFFSLEAAICHKWGPNCSYLTQHECVLIMSLTVPHTYFPIWSSGLSSSCTILWFWVLNCDDRLQLWLIISLQTALLSAFPKKMWRDLHLETLVINKLLPEPQSACLNQGFLRKVLLSLFICCQITIFCSHISAFLTVYL